MKKVKVQNEITLSNRDLDIVNQSLSIYRDFDGSQSYSSRSELSRISPKKEENNEESLAMILLGDYKSGSYRTPRRQSREIE